MVIVPLEGSPPPVLIQIHCKCAWSPEYDGGVARNSVEDREWGGATGRHCRFLVKVRAPVLGLAVWPLIRHLVQIE